MKNAVKLARVHTHGSFKEKNESIAEAMFIKKYINNKGITLVALVVTIIILLILAGVTIGFAMSGNGLFDKAKLATDEYNNKVQQEETEIGKTTNEINNYILGNRDYTPISYSTEEQDTGLKWIDGKTIYQKTVYTGSVTLTSNFKTLFTVPDVDVPISSHYIRKEGTYYDTTSIFDIQLINNGALQMRYVANYTGEFYVTIQYTKK